MRRQEARKLVIRFTVNVYLSQETGVRRRCLLDLCKGPGKPNGIPRYLDCAVVGSQLTTPRVAE